MKHVFINCRRCINLLALLLIFSCSKNGNEKDDFSLSVEQEVLTDVLGDVIERTLLKEYPNVKFDLIANRHRESDHWSFTYKQLVESSKHKSKGFNEMLSNFPFLSQENQKQIKLSKGCQFSSYSIVDVKDEKNNFFICSPINIVENKAYCLIELFSKNKGLGVLCSFKYNTEKEKWEYVSAYRAYKLS